MDIEETLTESKPWRAVSVAGECHSGWLTGLDPFLAELRPYKSMKRLWKIREREREIVLFGGCEPERDGNGFYTLSPYSACVSD